jgi:hypothetical protein
LYKQRKQLVSRTCRRYGLGNFPHPEKEEEEEEVEAGFYRRQEAAYSTPLEKSLMLEKNWRLLLCWNHKVVLIRGKKRPMHLSSSIEIHSTSRIHERTIWA